MIGAINCTTRQLADHALRSIRLTFSQLRRLARRFDTDNEAEVGFLCISGKPFLSALKDVAHSQHGLGISVITIEADALSAPLQLNS